MITPKERSREVRRNYYQRIRETQPLVKLINMARERAKKKGLPFDISVEDLSIPETCPVLGIPLFVSKFRATANSPSIDRIDNLKGYVKDNVRIISNRANWLKSDSTPEERRLIYLNNQGVL